MANLVSRINWGNFSRVMPFLAAFVFASCHPAPPAGPSKGARPYQFDPGKVTEITLAKSDPESGERWVSVMQKKHSADTSSWEIISAPADQPILDRTADELFLNHLLDLLPLVQVDDPAPNGPLDSFGLNPPRFALKWKTAAGEMELATGASVGNRPGRTFFRFQNAVFVGSGAAFDMLAKVTSFQTLRKKPWALISADEIDEIELRRDGKSTLYAQREGDRWTDRKHQKLDRDFDSLLQGLVTAEPLKFIDQPEEAVKIRKSIQTQTTKSAILKDRFGNLTTLQFQNKNGTVYGINNTRPEGVFILQPKILSSF